MGAPVSGPVTQVFGHNGHRGIDYGVPAGTPVHATISGTVVRADYDNNLPSFGYHVRIQQGNRLDILGHGNGRFYVKVGDKVTAGQVVMDSGSSGTSTGNHVHWEVRISGKPVNPTTAPGGSSSSGGLPSWIGAIGGIVGQMTGVGVGTGIEAGVKAGQGDLGGAAGALGGGVLGGLDAVGAFFGALGQQSTWVRVLQVVGGTALIVGGVIITGRGVIANTAVAAIPGGSALKAAAGK